MKVRSPGVRRLALALAVALLSCCAPAAASAASTPLEIALGKVAATNSTLSTITLKSGSGLFQLRIAPTGSLQRVASDVAAWSAGRTTSSPPSRAPPSGSTRTVWTAPGR